MLDLPSLAERLSEISSLEQLAHIYQKSEGATDNTESLSWQEELEAFHSDYGAVGVEE